MNTNPYDPSNGYTPPPQNYPEGGSPGAAPNYPPAGNYPPQYPQQSYPNPYGGPPQAYGQNPDGARHAKNSLIFGIIGLLIFGLVFGPLAIWQAGKAEALGVSAKPGKIMGWIAVGFSALVLAYNLSVGFSR